MKMKLINVLPQATHANYIEIIKNGKSILHISSGYSTDIWNALEAKNIDLNNQCYVKFINDKCIITLI